MSLSGMDPMSMYSGGAFAQLHQLPAPSEPGVDSAGTSVCSESPMGRLRLRATFIDVEAAPEDDEEPAKVTRTKRRVRTAPCVSSVTEEQTDELFTAERAYVEGLSEKLASMGISGRATSDFFECDPMSPTSSWASHASPHSTAYPRLDALNPCYVAMAAPGDHSRAGGRSLAEGLRQQTPLLVDPTTLRSRSFDSTAPSRHLGGVGSHPSGVGSHGLLSNMYLQAKVDHHPGPPGLAFAGADLDADDDDLLAPTTGGEVNAHNPGSQGHPELCNRPCLFFAQGTCSSFDTCEFCHLPHKKRLAHLDKRHRDMLHELPLDRWTTLVLPMLRSRVLAVDGSPAMAGLLDGIWLACRGRPGFEEGEEDRQAPWTSRSERMVYLKLKSMGLRSLIATVQRSLSLRGLEVDNSMDTILHRLRGLSASDL